MTTLPLLSHPSPDSIVAWRPEGAVTRTQFLAEVCQLVARLPAGAHLLNLCSDRYRFSVGLAAAIVAGKTCLLPSSHVPEVIRQIRDFAPDAFGLSDREDCTVELPLLHYPQFDRKADYDEAVPQIDSQQRIAILFTSGSTGIPQPHAKYWGGLLASVKAEAARLGLSAGASTSFVGTVPPQHMYGFESTVLIAWQTGNALSAAHPTPERNSRTSTAFSRPLRPWRPGSHRISRHAATRDWWKSTAAPKPVRSLRAVPRKPRPGTCFPAHLCVARATGRAPRGRLSSRPSSSTTSLNRSMTSTSCCTDDSPT